MESAFAVLLLAVASFLGVGTRPKKERVLYLDFEHINVTYYNPKYFNFANATALRYGRSDPIHYINLNVDLVYAFGNNVSIDIYVYEFLSNEYRPSFVELHFGVCDMMVKNSITKLAFSRFGKSCPFKPGVLHLPNISFPNVPILKTFPFTKGRLFANGSLQSTGESIFTSYTDVAIKERWTNKQ